MRATDVLIIGGGVAGAALAYHLSLRGAAVTLLERGDALGLHASGRNARLVLQAVAEPVVRALTMASVTAYTQRAGELGFDACGSLLLGSPERLAARRCESLSSRLLGPDEARRRVPLLAEARFAAALETPGDGVLDPHQLLAWYREQASRRGACFALDAELTRVAGSGPFTVDSSAGSWRAERLVVAAGAWAATVAERAGGRALPLAARKRHLFLLDHPLPPGQPFVWELERDLYLRADQGGATLACMCDEEPGHELDETVSPRAEQRLRAAFAPWLPTLSRAPLRRAWACFRTHAPDGLPVIGPDPGRPALWWLAALGGHGLGSSWEVGRLAAEGLLAGAERLPAVLRPDRLQPSRFLHTAPHRQP